MGLLLRQAWKELWAEKRFALLFVLNLSLGLSGLVSMEAFRASLSQSLAENAESLLGADVAITSRRILNAEERSAVEELAAKVEARAELAETFSMVRTPGASRLVLLRGMSPNFPLRGTLELSSGGRVEGGKGPLLQNGEAWMDPELARQLKLELGQKFSLGEQEFALKDLVALDPTQSIRGLALAGRILLPLESLRQSGLLKTESTASYTHLFRFAEGARPKDIAREWSKRFPDPSIKVSAAGDAADESGRLLLYLSDFLGLAALVALFLSSLGSAYLFRTWLVRRSRTFALQQVLGLPFASAASIPALQALLLAALAMPFALGLGLAEMRALAYLVRSLAPVDLHLSLSWDSLLLPVAVASLGTFF